MPLLIVESRGRKVTYLGRGVTKYMFKNISNHNFATVCSTMGGLNIVGDISMSLLFVESGPHKSDDKWQITSIRYNDMELAIVKYENGGIIVC